MFISKITNFYKRFEKYISAIGLIYGFIFTSLTLTRVDTFWENFWIVFHLILAAVGILALTFYENRHQGEETSLRFYLILLIQFAFGGLFSTFFVFYMRSASLLESWIFLAILVVLLIGNEVWKKHYTRLTFQVSVLLVSTYLFLIFLLPVLFHRLGADLFILAGVLSLSITFSFLLLLKKVALEKFKNSRNTIRLSFFFIVLVMNVMYFTNVMPPIPLSLKESGVFHNLVKTADGNYRATVEKTVWRDFFDQSPVFHRKPGETVYVFSAIFSPVDFATQIVHQWQYYDEIKKEWINSVKITLPIFGGREDGFRTYSTKQVIAEGLWRVKVMTTKGQTIGTIRFEVENTTANQVIDTIQKVL